MNRIQPSDNSTTTTPRTPGASTTAIASKTSPDRGQRIHLRPPCQLCGCVLNPPLYHHHHHHHRLLMMMSWFSTPPPPPMPSNGGFEPVRNVLAPAPQVGAINSSLASKNIATRINQHAQVHSRSEQAPHPTQIPFSTTNVVISGVLLAFRAPNITSTPLNGSSELITSPQPLDMHNPVYDHRREVGGVGAWGLSGYGRSKQPRKATTTSLPNPSLVTLSSPQSQLLMPSHDEQLFTFFGEQLLNYNPYTNSTKTLPERPSPSKRVRAPLDRITSISFDLNITSLFTATSNDVDASTLFHLDPQYLRLLTAFWLVGDFDLTSKTVQRRLYLTFGRNFERKLTRNADIVQLSYDHRYTIQRSRTSLAGATTTNTECYVQVFSREVGGVGRIVEHAGFKVDPLKLNGGFCGREWGTITPAPSNDGFEPRSERLRENVRNVLQRETQASPTSLKYTTFMLDVSKLQWSLLGWRRTVQRAQDPNCTTAVLRDLTSTITTIKDFGDLFRKDDDSKTQNTVQRSGMDVTLYQFPHGRGVNTTSYSGGSWNLDDSSLSKLTSSSSEVRTSKFLVSSSINTPGNGCPSGYGNCVLREVQGTSKSTYTPVATSPRGLPV
ncbi:hypothetical protein BDN72DRAFT_862569 [Pluteus cervinus]|uniref:Uncharacterized protein n=1 Tax=Pluteus cervinus TaxID=181527 RepID=A0ACD3AAQ8_9AGAR|nr:hypothetical protein BDN72DRAFT_862569 [Pluteus cervinus]